MIPRRFPKWAESLLQVVVSVGVALAGLAAWSHQRGEAAGLDSGQLIEFGHRLAAHVDDRDIHFDRDDAERLVRVEEGVNSMKGTLEALSRRGAK